jgi:hypothetical protein
MRLLQIFLFLIVPVFLLAIFIFPKYTHASASTEENYGRSGVPSVPLDILIPKKPIKDLGTFVSYPETSFHQICPSKPGTHCNSVLDCGPAELCIDQAGWIASGTVDKIQPKSSVCVCSIQNACISGENIC